MKACSEWWTALSAYVDEFLSSAERERVEAHLEQCPGCRQAVIDLQALRQSVRLLPRPEPPPMLKARILAATVDQPTWTERLAMGWKPLAWRFSLAAALAVLAWIAWLNLPREVPQAVNTLVSSVTQSQKPTASAQVKPSAPRPPQTPKAVVSSEKRAPSSARRAVASRPLPAAPRAARREAPSPSIARVAVPPAPVPADALHGEPLIEQDVPYIDVTSPPAGASEQVATQPEEENKTVATRFSIPAEVLPQDTTAMEALRQQIRIQNQEQWSGQVKRKLQRNQVDIDVITVRF